MRLASKRRWGLQSKDTMPPVKFLVLYPRPKDIETFEKLYQNEHVPMAVEKLVGKTKFVATKVLGSPAGTPPFYRVAEIHFPSMAALEACARFRRRKGDFGTRPLDLNRG